jgi:hypothetical protein
MYITSVICTLACARVAMDSWPAGRDQPGQAFDSVQPRGVQAMHLSASRSSVFCSYNFCGGHMDVSK